jgi:outer membrane protein TolC
VRNELAARTALAYYQLYKSRQQIQIASDREAETIKEQEQVETLSAAGRVLHVEVTVAHNAVISARNQLRKAQEQANLAEMELRELTGLPGTVSIKTVEPRIENPAFNMQGLALYQQALECTPEILQSQANVKAKEYHVEAEKGESLPKAEIISEYAVFSKTNHYEDFFSRFSRHNYIVGLSLQVPIFNGFRTSSRVAQSRQEVSEARNRMESLKRDLKLSIERSLSEVRNAQDDSDLAHSDAELAREMLQVKGALLEAGRIGPKEMGESRSTLQQKELAQLEADQVLFQRKLELLRVAGTLASAF